MKQRKRMVGCFGIFALLIGLCLIWTIAALDTPWIPLEPNTTGKETETTTPSTTESEEITTAGSEEVTTPFSEEPTELETDPPTAEDPGEATREEPGAPASQEPAVRKKGCGSTLSGAALLLPLALGALIGKKRRY